MSDVLKNLNNRDVYGYVKKENLEDIADVGQYESTSTFKPFGPVPIGTTLEQRTSYLSGEIKNSAKFGAEAEFKNRGVGVAYDDENVEINGSFFLFGATVNSSGQVGGTISTEVLPGIELGHYIDFDIPAAFRNLARFGAGLDKGLYDSIKAETFKSIKHCFPSSTSIQTSASNFSTISFIQQDDLVLSFDPSSDNGRGALVPKKVVRTFTNITEEWLRLTWVEDGEEKELVTTPGHEYLAAQGGFRQIEQLVAGGAGTLVLADGSEVEVQSERLVYSAETADLCEQAEDHVLAGNGNLARKPECKKSGRPATSRSKSFIRMSLAEGLRKWAASLKASHTIIHVTTGSNLKSTDRLMKAAGAQFVGGAYVV